MESKLFTREDGTMVIVYFDGPTVGVKIIEPNLYEPGTDDYNNKWIDDWTEIRKYITPSPS